MIASCLCLAPISTAIAGPPGVWMGDQTKDPITDKTNSLAIIYDERDQGTIGVRCRSGTSDILVMTGSPKFTEGSKQEIVIRFGTSEPIKLAAIATEPRILAVDARNRPDVYREMMKPAPIALRFTGLYGREETMQFKAVLPANSLHMVGRVLADCGIAEYPKEEIDKAVATEFKSSAPAGKTTRAK